MAMVTRVIRAAARMSMPALGRIGPMMSAGAPSVLRAAPISLASTGAKAMSSVPQNFAAYSMRDTQGRCMIQMTVEAPTFEPTPFSKDDGSGPSSIKVARPGFVMLKMFPIVDGEDGSRPDWSTKRTARLYADAIGRIAVTPADRDVELTWKLRVVGKQDDNATGSLQLVPSRLGDGSVDLTVDDNTGEALTANIAAHQVFVFRHLMFSALPHITGLGSVFGPPHIGSGGGFSMA